MSKIFKNNKAFTLIELIIAISIFATVIFMGYRVLNKYDTALNEQSNIINGQSSMNNINTYVTNDLNKATSIKVILDGVEIADTKIEENNYSYEEDLLNSIIPQIQSKLNDDSITNFYYEYIIRDNVEDSTDSSYPKYKVEIKKSKNNMTYTISKNNENGVNIDFNNNIELKNKELPFTITGNNPYKVSTGYGDNKGNLNIHEYEVTSRINDAIEYELPEIQDPPETTIPSKDPEIDESIEGDNGYISFEYGSFVEDGAYGENKDSGTKAGNLRVSVGGANNKIIDRGAYQLGSSNEINIPICGIIDPKDNNGKVWAKIMTFGDDRGQGNGFHANHKYFGINNNINAINITVTEGAKLLDLKINGKPYTKDGELYTNLGTGKYTLINQASFNGQIKITGTLQKQSASGAIVVTFGTSKS